MGTRDFARLSDEIKADPAILDALIELEAGPRFTDALLGHAARLGLAVSPDDVERAIAAARAEWRSRWV